MLVKAVHDGQVNDKTYRYERKDLQTEILKHRFFSSFHHEVLLYKFFTFEVYLSLMKTPHLPVKITKLGYYYPFPAGFLKGRKQAATPTNKI